MKFQDPQKRRVMFQRTTTGFMIKLWRFHIYLANSPLKPRKLNDREKQKNKLRAIRLRKLHEGNGCELCGKHITAQTSELHHIKPLALYPQLKYVEDNLMLLCHDCHVGLHRDYMRKAYEIQTASTEGL